MKKLILACVLAWLFLPGTAKSQLNCAPAPCVTSNVQISESSHVTLEVPIVASADQLQLMSAANDYAGDRSANGCHESGAHSELGVRNSTNTGLNWSGGCWIPRSIVASYEADPVVAFDSSGNAFAGDLGFSAQSRCSAWSCWQAYLRKSTNRGLTWSPPFPTAYFVQFDGENFDLMDFDHLVIDTVKGGIYQDRMYMAFMEGSTFTADSTIVVGHSSNGGTAWSSVRVSSIATAPEHVNFPHMVIGDHETVYITWSKCTPYCVNADISIMFSSSTDGGVTWAPESEIFTIHSSPSYALGDVFGGLPGTFERMTPAAYLAYAKTVDGADVLESVEEHWNGSRIQVRLRRSTDRGNTWSSPRIVSSTSGDQFLPCIASDANSSGSGHYFGVLWLDRRNDSGNRKYDAYATASPDAGVTWSSNYKLSAHINDPSKNGLPYPFLGDYTGCAWAKPASGQGSELFYGTWPDTSNGTRAVGMIAGLNP